MKTVTKKEFLRIINYSYAHKLFKDGETIGFSSKEACRGLECMYTDSNLVKEYVSFVKNEQIVFVKPLLDFLPFKNPDSFYYYRIAY